MVGFFYFLGRWRLGRDAVGARGCWDGWLGETVLDWGVLTVPLGGFWVLVVLF